MTFTELGSPQELQSFLQQHNVCLVTFSAHWCGPCKASKPQLEVVAKDSIIPFGYCYESDLGEFVQTFSVRAFPTHICFVSGKEVERVEGVNFAGIEAMVSKHAQSKADTTGGQSLGGGASAVSSEEARQLRLARFGAAPAAAAPEAAKEEPKKKEEEAAATPMDTEESSPKQEQGADATMTEAVAKSSSSPVDDLDPEALKTLTESMGFSLIRAQKGLLHSSGNTVESAVEWLMQHQDDDDIDDPIPEGPIVKAQSYKCNDCGKVLSNMANLEMHANKTGHSDFEESTQAVTPLTEEEKAAKIVQIKDLLAKKRAEREEAEKVDQVQQEISRRGMGKEMQKTKEQMDHEQRKRDTRERKREKLDAKRERERIRAELEKDKRERIANNGKLLSKLGVDGYAPDAIQYDDGTDEPAPQKPKKEKAAISVAQIDAYITKVSSYRASGDGAKALKILKAYVSNVADNPTEEKFKTINMENKTYKSKIKPFIGAKHLLLAVGFAPKEGDPTLLVLKPDADQQVLKETKDKLIKAVETFA